MSEAIKGQDKLKLAVERLESEIFKDWTDKPITSDVIWVIFDSCGSFTITGCTIHNSSEGVRPL
jgi:hypothetical protein